MLGGTFVYSASKARAAPQFFWEFMSTAPDDLQAECWLTNLHGGWFAVQLVYAGKLEDGERVVKALRSFSTPEQDLVKRRLFSEIYDMEGDVEFASCPLLSEKGIYVEHFSDDAIELILDRFAQPPPSCALLFNFSHYMHGQVCRVPPEATAFELRRANAVHLVSLVQWKNRADTSACLSWHNKTFELLQEYSGGRIFANELHECRRGACSETYFRGQLRTPETVESKIRSPECLPFQSEHPAGMGLILN